MQPRHARRGLCALAIGAFSIVQSPTLSLAATASPKPAASASPAATPTAASKPRDYAMLIDLGKGKQVIEISDFQMAATKPRDSQSGLAGKRQHDAVTITTASDASSADLLRAQTAGMRIPKVFVHVRGTTIELDDVVIVNVEHERFTLVYQKIEMSHRQSGTSAADDWTAPTT